MKISNLVLSTFLASSALGSPFIRASFAQSSSRENPYNQEEITTLCTQSGEELPPSGIQPNGESASSIVMQLTPGQYTYPDGGLILFPNSTFFVRLPAGSSLSGTAGPDAFYGSQRIIGGCSVEQLSELIAVNGLDARRFELATTSTTNSNDNSPPPVNALEAIAEFCATSENKPQPGMQFDGKAASPTVLELAAGIYVYPDEGVLIITEEKHYFLQLPTTRQGIYGTDGDDYIIGSGVVAGCSAEQLSEAIANNSISTELLVKLE